MYWYIFSKDRCIGKYPYKPADVPNAVIVRSDTDYTDLRKLRYENGQIIIATTPPPDDEPTEEIIEEENYSAETVEIYNALAGLYETLAERTDAK